MRPDLVNILVDGILRVNISITKILLFGRFSTKHLFLMPLTLPRTHVALKILFHPPSFSLSLGLLQQMLFSRANFHFDKVWTDWNPKRRLFGCSQASTSGIKFHGYTRFSPYIHQILHFSNMWLTASSSGRVLSKFPKSLVPLPPSVVLLVLTLKVSGYEIVFWFWIFLIQMLHNFLLPVFPNTMEQELLVLFRC